MRRRVPFIAQVEAADCGPAALASILAYYGRWESLSDVRNACPASRDGASALALVAAAESYGLTVEAFKGGFEELRDVALPAILFWNFNHFVVLERVARGRVAIVDPGAGRLTLPFDVAAKSFSNVILTFAPGPSFEPNPRRGLSFAQFVPAVRAHRGAVAQIVTISLCIQLLSLSLPFATKLLMDASKLPSYGLWIALVTLALGGGMLAATLFSLARGLLLDRLQRTLDQSLSTELVRHLLALPLAFFLHRRPGEVIQRLSSMAAIRAVLTTAFTSSLLDVLTLLVLTGFVVDLSPPLAAVIIALALVKAAVLWQSRKATRELLTAEMIADGREMTTFIETFSALETVRATASEQHVIERWYRNTVTRANQATRRRRAEGYEQTARDLLSAGGIIAIVAFGVPLAESGALTAGGLAAIIVIHGLINTPLDALLTALGQLQHIGRHMAWIEDITNAPAERSGDLVLRDLPLSISVDNVSFRYAPSTPDVLSGISLEVVPGQHIAIVGPTGAGKSTLARMLVGLIAPTEGTIRFGGTHLVDVDLRWLRSRVAIVLQDVDILNADVLTNLRLYRPEASLGEVRQAAAMAAIDHVIERLDGGYGHILRANGKTLSGGERQRLAIARAVLGNPAVLVLDEATSALDAETEERVMNHLAKPGFTRISVAHRLETVRGADRIYVLDRGCLVQSGTYEELMEQEDGLFRSLAFNR